MESMNELYSKVKSGEIEFNLDNFEAIDNQGYTLEGFVTYKEIQYNIILSFLNELSYEEQIAKQIFEHLNNV